MRCHFEESLRETIHFMDEYILGTKKIADETSFFSLRKKWALKGAYLSALVIVSIIKQKYSRASIRDKQTDQEGATGNMGCGSN